MNHEELLTKMAQIAHTKDANEARNDYLLALRAVVKLHNPEPMPLPDEAEDDVCGFCWHSGARWFYPCPTIEAIEKELT